MNRRRTLSPEQWEREQQILHDALEHEDAERDAFVEEACGDDRDLRSELASLLNAYRQGGLPSDPDEIDVPRIGELERLKRALASRYAIDRPLGAGGTATVYLANDLKHTRKVAIKVLCAELSATLGADRLLREIRIAARLRHPNIVPLYDSGETDDFLYYVKPVEGETSLRVRREINREPPIVGHAHVS